MILIALLKTKLRRLSKKYLVIYFYFFENEFVTLFEYDLENLLENSFVNCLENDFVNVFENDFVKDFLNGFEDLVENIFIFEDYAYSSSKTHIEHFNLFEAFSKMIFIHLVL